MLRYLRPRRPPGRPEPEIEILALPKARREYSRTGIIVGSLTLVMIVAVVAIIAGSWGGLRDSVGDLFSRLDLLASRSRPAERPDPSDFGRDQVRERVPPGASPRDPFYSDAEIGAWAAAAVSASLQLTSVGWAEDIAWAGRLCTAEGEASLRRAVEESGLSRRLAGQRITLHVHPAGEPTLRLAGARGETYRWLIATPITLEFHSAARTHREAWTATVSVDRVPSDERRKLGLAFSNWSLQPD